MKPEVTVWVDVETNGLGLPGKVRLYEVGVRAYSSTERRGLKPIDDGEVRLVGPLPSLSEMEPLVVDMHAKSGLLVDMRSADDEGALWRPENAQHAFCSYIEELGLDESPVMCGASVHFDRKLIEYWMPVLFSAFHYRNIDVSSIREYAKRFRPQAFAEEPKDRKIHRPIPDIEDSVKLLQHYRGWL